MNGQDFKPFIIQLRRQNYSQFSASYPSIIAAAVESVKTVAQYYWDGRHETQVERDAQYGLTFTDFEAWVISQN